MGMELHGQDFGGPSAPRCPPEPSVCPQEERPTFDIHSYGVALAERCQPLGQWHPFASLVCGLPPFEVSRYLLAALQLVSVGMPTRALPAPSAPHRAPLPPALQANDLVLELAQEEGLEEAVDTLRLRLLSAPQEPLQRLRRLQLSAACPAAPPAGVPPQ